MLKIEALNRELENLKRRYALTATELMDRAEKARSRAADSMDKSGSFSNHDAFNCAATAAELATLAGKIEQTENVVRWMTEAK